MHFKLIFRKHKRERAREYFQRVGNNETVKSKTSNELISQNRRLDSQKSLQYLNLAHMFPYITDIATR